MTVIVSKPAVNLREELASLRNQGGYQEQQFYFDGLVTNGTFDSDTAWTKGTGWTISGGVATFNSGSGSDLSQTGFSFAAGKTYTIKVDMTHRSGSGFRFVVDTLGSAVSGYFASTATHTFSFSVSATSTRLRLGALGGSDFDIDNLSIFEVDANDDVIHTMPKGWKPKDVFEDGLLQREGAAHDYEVVYDGFDYYVKPTVAPSATTQTCVIGVKA